MMRVGHARLGNQRADAAPGRIGEVVGPRRPLAALAGKQL
jgi:hypothetical protein